MSEVLLIVSIILNIIYVPAYHALKSTFKRVEADEQKYFHYWLNALKKKKRKKK